MKSKIKYAVLVALLLIFGLLSLILFLTIPDERLSDAVFWLSFSFAIPVNFLMLSGFTIWGFTKKGADFIKLPVAAIVSGIFGGIYLLVGALFMYLPAKEIAAPLILYTVITVAFAITAIFSVSGVNYMTGVEARIKEKRIFIKMLEADILDCAAKANEDTADLLRKLAEDIRFSDPMSHSSLSAIETELSSSALALSEALSENENADVSEMIKRMQSLLKSRNTRCQMLK